MRPVTHLNHELPIYIAMRQQWVADMERLHFSEANRSMDMLGRLCVLGVLVTVCLVLAFA